MQDKMIESVSKNKMHLLHTEIIVILQQKIES